MMVTGVLVKQDTRVSAAMVSTQLSQNIPGSA